MSGLFEHLAAQDDSAAIAHRKASAVATKRVKDQFGLFLANARGDLPARYSLVEDDISGIVTDVVAEYGGDAAIITAAIKKALMPGTGTPNMGVSPMGGSPMGGSPMGGSPMAPGAPGGPGAPAQPGQGQGTCPQCGGPMVNGQCPTCQGGAYGGAGAGGAYGLTHSIPQPPSTGPVQASVKEARRPKMCPYHSEVVDISLGSGDSQAGYNAMGSHAWGDKHCKGGFEGTCNFRPAMVTQQYWDDKKAEYEERRQQREVERQQAPIEPELSIDTEPIMHAEPLSDEPGKEGVTDIDGELENAPSAVGAGDMAMAASTRQAEALETVDLPTGGESGLGGPSPKIDKSNSGDQAGWNLKPIDTQMDGSPHPSIEQDPTDKADYNKEDFLDQTRAVTETVELDSAPDLMNDAGFAPGGEEHGPHTDTWSGQDGQANPVSREAVSHSDPDKNPLREILEEYQGAMMPNQVESALREWQVG